MPQKRWLVLVAILAFGVFAACGKGDPVECDKMCRNYGTLMFWKIADAEIEAAPADQRDALRKTKLAELASKMEAGVGFCISKCEAANNPELMKCVIDAKTATAVNACADTEQQHKNK